MEEKESLEKPGNESDESQNWVLILRFEKKRKVISRLKWDVKWESKLITYLYVEDFVSSEYSAEDDDQCKSKLSNYYLKQRGRDMMKK